MNIQLITSLIKNKINSISIHMYFGLGYCHEIQRITRVDFVFIELVLGSTVI